MTPRGWLWLIARDVSAQKRRAALLILCLLLSATLVGIVYTAFAYMREEVRPRLRELFPERRVVIRSRTGEVLFLQTQGPRITEKAVRAYREMPEAEAVYPQLSAAFPVSAEFNMESIGTGFQTDIILFGVPREMVADDIFPPAEKAPPRGGEKSIPVLISEYFLDAYNLGLAESSGMPKLGRSAVLGIEFDLILGESTVALGESAAPARTVPARVVGLTPNPDLFGVIMPLGKLKDYNAVHAPQKTTAYTALHIDLADPAGLPAVQQKARDLGLEIDAQAETLERYLRIIRTIEGILFGALAAVLLLAAVGVSTTTGAIVRSQRPRWGLYRATGLPPHGVRLLATGHALAASLPAGFLAMLLVTGILKGLSGAFGEAVRELSIIPGDPFAPSLSLYLVIAVFSLLFAILPAWFFTRSITKTRPAELFAERSL